MSCDDQVSTQDLINSKLDVITQAEIATSRLGGVSSGQVIFESTDRLGNKHLTAEGALARIGASPINGGVWASGITFTAYNEYMIYNGVAYKPKGTTSLPYVSANTPDMYNVEPYVLHNITSSDVSLIVSGKEMTVDSY